MAEDAVNIAIQQKILPERPCVTEELPIHGALTVTSYNSPGYYYGSDLIKIKQLESLLPSLAAMIHPRLPYGQACIVWAAREEMCMTVDDALSRRTRAILLDAAAAIESAPLVASLLANEYGYTKDWEMEQVSIFTALATNYLPNKTIAKTT